MARRLELEYGADTAQISRAVNRIRDEHNQLGGAIAGTGRSASGTYGSIAKGAAALGVGVVTLDKVKDALVASVSRASDLNEEISKSKVVFGGSQKAVADFADTATEKLGISRVQALQATGTFGNLFTALKIGQQDSADMSTKLVQLAGDLASFNNVDPTEALDALRSGLVGETEPLKRFGVNLNEATIKQKAFELGLISSVKEGLTPAQKAQASYALILAQTTKAQGDAGRTIGGFAGQQRVLAAEFDNLKTEIGQQLLPVAMDLVKVIRQDVIPAARELTPVIKFLGETIGVGFERASEAIQGITHPIDSAKGKLREIGLALGIVEPNIDDVRTAFESAGKELDLGRPKLDGTTIALQRMHGEAKETTTAVETFSGVVVEELDAAGKKALELATGLESNFATAGDVFAKFADDSKINLDKVRKELELSVKHQTEFFTNLDTIIARGGDHLAEQILAMGPKQGAAFAAAVAGAKPEQLTALENATAAQDSFLQTAGAKTAELQGRLGIDAVSSFAVGAEEHVRSAEVQKKLQEVGALMQLGIAVGIRNSTFAARRAMGDSITEAMRAAQLAAKITSPSKLFADEVGKPIGEGIAAGIAYTHGAVNSAVKRVTESAAISIGGAPFAAAPNNASASASITVSPGAVQVNFNGPVDRETLPEVEEVVDRAFGQLLSALDARR